MLLGSGVRCEDASNEKCYNEKSLLRDTQYPLCYLFAKSFIHKEAIYCQHNTGLRSEYSVFYFFIEDRLNT